jgi:hypothetical protein
VPDLDHLNTRVSKILHELMHTHLFSDGQMRAEAECVNSTIRGVDYFGLRMYGAGRCAAMAELSGLMGGGLDLTSQNADCFSLAASSMCWAEHFNGHMPGDGRPAEIIEGPMALRLAYSSSPFANTALLTFVFVGVYKICSWTIKALEWLDRQLHKLFRRNVHNEEVAMGQLVEETRAPALQEERAE